MVGARLCFEASARGDWSLPCVEQLSAESTVPSDLYVPRWCPARVAVEEPTGVPREGTRRGPKATHAAGPPARVPGKLKRQRPVAWPARGEQFPLCTPEGTDSTAPGTSSVTSCDRKQWSGGAAVEVRGRPPRRPQPGTRSACTFLRTCFAWANADLGSGQRLKPLASRPTVSPRRSRNVSRSILHRQPRNVPNTSLNLSSAEGITVFSLVVNLEDRRIDDRDRDGRLSVSFEARFERLGGCPARSGWCPTRVAVHEILWIDVLESAHRRLEPFAAALSLNNRQHRGQDQDDADEGDDQQSDASSSSTTGQRLGRWSPWWSRRRWSSWRRWWS